MDGQYVTSASAPFYIAPVSTTGVYAGASMRFSRPVFAERSRGAQSGRGAGSAGSPPKRQGGGAAAQRAAARRHLATNSSHRSARRGGGDARGDQASARLYSQRSGGGSARSAGGVSARSQSSMGDYYSARGDAAELPPGEGSLSRRWGQPAPSGAADYERPVQRSRSALDMVGEPQIEMLRKHMPGYITTMQRNKDMHAGGTWLPDGGTYAMDDAQRFQSMSIAKGAAPIVQTEERERDRQVSRYISRLRRRNEAEERVAAAYAAEEGDRSGKDKARIERKADATRRYAAKIELREQEEGSRAASRKKVVVPRWKSRTTEGSATSWSSSRPYAMSTPRVGEDGTARIQAVWRQTGKDSPQKQRAGGQGYTQQPRGDRPW